MNHTKSVFTKLIDELEAEINATFLLAKRDKRDLTDVEWINVKAMREQINLLSRSL